MKSFNQIVKILSPYEDKWANCAAGVVPSLPTCANGAVQFVGIEPGANASHDTELPVVVAVGINYDQGQNPDNHLRWLRDVKGMPDGVTDCYWQPGKPSDMRNTLDYALACYQRNQPEWVAKQNNGCVHSTGVIPPLDDYILIAANLCPFITKSQWTSSPSPDCTRMKYLWPHAPHLHDLTFLLGNDVVLWVGHGKDCVWPDFLNWVSSSPQKSPWILTYNLSRQGLANMKGRHMTDPLFA